MGVAIVLVASCAVSIARVVRPPSPVPATAPDTVFSAERAMRHVAAIAVRPHAMGMPDHDRVRDYIVSQIAALGLRPQIQRTTAIGTRYPEAGRVQNILTWLPGSTPNSKAVLLMAHYDGVEAGPAAADDGAGCAALLETLRALRSRKQPLGHDVFVLFTDGEEAGLLGAAAFVREHPWAKDVGVVLNFEARGTTGRSFMFETGPGNLDVVRTLRVAKDVTTGSIFTTIYRTLPNDTDLSELEALGLPAMNFAFAGGVERYHTTRDDLEHLNPGSLQHHGVQMLSLAKAFANESLPRPQTGDAVFFDAPIVGLVLYPEWMAVVLAFTALVLMIVVVQRDESSGVLRGIAGLVVAVVVCVAIALLINPTGPARWSGLTAAAWAALVLAVNAMCFAIARRGGRTPHQGALIVWAALALVTSMIMPGASYLFTWPLLFVAIAELSGRPVARWIAAILTLLMLIGLTYAVAVVMLGVATTGAAALAVLVSLVAWLLAPVLEEIAGSSRWLAAPWLALTALVLTVLVVLTARPTAAHPVRTALFYIENADERDAWLGSASLQDAWTRSVIGRPEPMPGWTHSISEFGARLSGRAVPRVALQSPDATMLRDTIIAGARRVVVRITAPQGTTGLVMHAFGAPISRTAIDARVVDTTRYRYHPPVWTMQYWAVPDSGAVVSLAIPVGEHIDIELAARRPGLPAIPGLRVPPRPSYVVPSQSGDATILYRRIRF